MPVGFYAGFTAVPIWKVIQNIQQALQVETS
jgi:hypothetical protein